MVIKCYVMYCEKRSNANGVDMCGCRWIGWEIYRGENGTLFVT